MKRLKRILFFSTVLILTGTYAYLQMYTKITHLSDEDLKWMSAYNVNDTIYFRNETVRDIDTLTVTEVYINNRKAVFNSYPFSFRSEYKAKAGYHFDINHKDSLYDRNYFSINKCYEDMRCFQRWLILGLSSDIDTIFDVNENYVGFPDGIRTKMTTVNINGQVFNDCIIGNYDNSHESDVHPTLIEEFIWSRRHGLLQYKSEGETYTRIDMEGL